MDVGRCFVTNLSAPIHACKQASMHLPIVYARMDVKSSSKTLLNVKSCILWFGVDASTDSQRTKFTDMLWS